MSELVTDLTVFQVVIQEMIDEDRCCCGKRAGHTGWLVCATNEARSRGAV